MKRLIVLAIIVILGIWTAKAVLKKNTVLEKNSVASQETPSYWTCPMHPQIHADHPGECPICHMTLIQVKQQSGKGSQDSDNRAPVQGSASQLELIGVQRTTVEKMDLKIQIPVSGRFLSAGTVAFQIYESDLRYIKAGLAFTGESSFYPEEAITGTIVSVDSIVDPTSRTVRVVGSVRKGAHGALSETGFRGNIEIDLKDRTAIPESAVMHTGAGDLVYLFSNGNELTPKLVKLGLKTEGFYDVIDGVTVGQTISSGPNFLLDSEAKIRGL